MSTDASGRRVASLAREHAVPAELVVVDDVGLGAGTLDTCRAEGVGAAGFTGGAAPVACRVLPGTLTFNNLRSQGWWHLRTLFEDGALSLAGCPEASRRKLQEDLLAPRYRTGQERRIEVEPKEGHSRAWGLKARLGRSPDYGDALMMAAFAEHLRPARRPRFHSLKAA